MTEPPGAISSCPRMSASTAFRKTRLHAQRSPSNSLLQVRKGRCGRCLPGACRSSRRGASAGAFSGRTKRQTVGVRSSRSRQRSLSPRVALPCRRASGSTHTCWSWTALGVHAEASALNRIVPFSTQSQERPSSICAAVRRRKPTGSRRSGSTPSSSSCVSAQAGTSRSRSSSVAARRPARPGLRRLVEHVDRLAGPVLAWTRHDELGGAPELGDRLLLADDHARRASWPRRPRTPSSPRPDGTTFAPK